MPRRTIPQGLVWGSAGRAGLGFDSEGPWPGAPWWGQPFACSREDGLAGPGREGRSRSSEGGDRRSSEGSGEDGLASWGIPTLAAWPPGCWCHLLRWGHGGGGVSVCLGSVLSCCPREGVGVPGEEALGSGPPASALLPGIPGETPPSAGGGSGETETSSRSSRR